MLLRASKYSPIRGDTGGVTDTLLAMNVHRPM